MKAWFDHFDLLAPIYDRLIRSKDTDQLARLACLNANARLLDAGGGTGRIGFGLADRAGQVVVLDPSVRMLAQGRKKPRLRLVAGHAEHLPFPSQCFDRIVMVDAFHHLADQEQSLEELWRILAHDGIMVIEEPDITHPAVKLVALVEHLALMPSHFRRAEWIAPRLSALGASVSVARQDYTAWVRAEKDSR